MEKIVVVVFNDKENAFTASRALDDMHRDGDITLYASAVVEKKDDGNVATLQEAPDGPIGTGVGILAGSLIGLLGGPVGVAIGAYVGSISGLAYDLAKLGVSEDFLGEVGEFLLPGRVAVVADVYEFTTTPIDARMDALGGIVFRRSRNDYSDYLIEQDAAAFRAEIADLEAEIADANAETKAKIQAKIDTAKAKLKATQEKAKAAAEEAKREMEAKVNSLKVQITTANAEKKAKLEKRIAEIEADYKKRNEKLRQAWELTKEAVAG